MRETRKREPPVLAIDLGGTKIIAAIVNAGQVQAKEYCLTLADEGPEPVIKRIISAIDRLLKDTGLPKPDSISIAAAGAIDSDKGLVTESPNLPGWYDAPLRDIVEEKYGFDTFLINDASAAALGEHCFGAGKGTNNLIFLTVSTGIGGGIIIDGRLYLGACGAAGEVGHMTIEVNGPKCNCGNTGCLEILASGTAMAKKAIERVKGGEASSLLEIAKGKIEDITAEKIQIAAQGGDALALDVIHQAATYLGVGMANLVNIFNPELIIVGGGVANMGDLLLNPARQVIRERAFRLSAQAVRVIPAQLGEDAGVLGAAAFARQQKSVS